MSDDKSINIISASFQHLSIDLFQHNYVIIIQKIWRGNRIRKANLPLILRYVQKALSLNSINVSSSFQDGRTNSCVDEDTIINFIKTHYPNRIRIAKSRMWYDILLLDNTFGWIPINIKTTTTKTNDNVGNLALCVYAYTNEYLDFDQSYNNGFMSDILFKKIRSNEVNWSYKKDYFFLVVNKQNTSDVIINSIRGLTSITPNTNNLPFQVNWSKNRTYNYKSVKLSIIQYKDCIKKNKPSWQQRHILNMNSLE